MKNNWCGIIMDISIILIIVVIFTMNKLIYDSFEIIVLSLSVTSIMF